MRRKDYKKKDHKFIKLGGKNAIHIDISKFMNSDGKLSEFLKLLEKLLEESTEKNHDPYIEFTAICCCEEDCSVDRLNLHIYPVVKDDDPEYLEYKRLKEKFEK